MGTVRISCSVITGVRREFPSSQCNPSAEAAFRNTKVTDLKEYEVGLEIAVWGRSFLRACSGYFIAKQRHKMHIHVKLVDCNGQNVFVHIYVPFFFISADACIAQKCYRVKFCFHLHWHKSAAKPV